MADQNSTHKVEGPNIMKEAVCYRDNLAHPKIYIYLTFIAAREADTTATLINSGIG